MIRYVRPIYPGWARKQGIEGIVEFVGTVGKDGRVRDLVFVKGPKLLAPFAEAAIREWRYETVSFETETQILIDFTLRQ